MRCTALSLGFLGNGYTGQGRVQVMPVSLVV